MLGVLTNTSPLLTVLLTVNETVTSTSWGLWQSLELVMQS